jgi:hypothetical protein
MLAVALISFGFASFAYTRISSQEVIPGLGLKLALTSVFLLFFGAYFYSQSEKSKAVTFGYIDKSDNSPLDEYRGILSGHEGTGEDNKKEKNMTLPI